MLFCANLLYFSSRMFLDGGRLIVKQITIVTVKTRLTHGRIRPHEKIGYYLVHGKTLVSSIISLPRILVLYTVTVTISLTGLSMRSFGMGIAVPGGRLEQSPLHQFRETDETIIINSNTSKNKKLKFLLVTVTTVFLEPPNTGAIDWFAILSRGNTRHPRFAKEICCLPVPHLSLQRPCRIFERKTTLLVFSYYIVEIFLQRLAGVL